MNKTLKTVLQIALTIVIVLLAYFVVESIMNPVRFKQERQRREKVVIQNLKDIRSAENAYKDINDTYTDDFDSLISFIKKGEIPVVNIIQDPTDTTYTKTINDTIDYVNVQDSIFKDRSDFKPEKIDEIPYSKGEKFKIQTDTIQKGGVAVNVIEVKAHYNDFLKGMDEQLILNRIKQRKDIDRYPGLKFGSLKERNTDGNWE
ncbi:MAG: hypothetical protein K9J27_01445 [Bacteroidales bacterium]|nr:hypothetical protein [Bacteroidales bacterium]MCF8332638.1 hypothetical protein [Bacteroidales bacterium]